MQYFDTLPKIIYTDNYGIKTIRTNLMARASVIPSTFQNPILYYKYDIQDGDTPEIIAHKYYNDMYRYWIVLFSNNMLDPQWSWPLSGNVFETYIQDKYGYNQSTGMWTTNPYTTIDHYQKTITQFDVNTQTTTTNVLTIDYPTYLTTQPLTNTYTLPTGPVTVSVSVNPVSVYDNEVTLNEAKRNINILNVRYIDEFETEFQKLMSM